jgi:L-seryl-tRNA(Ser) seleniumtransferase
MGNFVSRELTGSVNGDQVTIASSQTERYGDSLQFRFTGAIAGDTLSGALDMGEYPAARRHRYGQG